MSDLWLNIAFIALMFICIPLGVLMMRDRVSSPSEAEMDEGSGRFIERLQNPDFAALEDSLGHELPARLKALYEDGAEIMRDDFEVAPSQDTPEARRWYIAYYEPADEMSMRDVWPGCEEYFSFANDGSGNGYMIDPRLDDPPVLFHDHETGEIQTVCEHLSEFLDWPKMEVEG